MSKKKVTAAEGWVSAYIGETLRDYWFEADGGEDGTVSLVHYDIDNGSFTVRVTSVDDQEADYVVTVRAAAE